MVGWLRAVPVTLTFFAGGDLGTHDFPADASWVVLTAESMLVVAPYALVGFGAIGLAAVLDLFVSTARASAVLDS